jgi:hypothetical protein
MIPGQHLNTKEQTELILKSWGQKLPAKNEVLYVSFAGQPLNLCTVMLSKARSTYNKTLYLMEFQSVLPGQMPRTPKDVDLTPICCAWPQRP